MAEVVVLNRWRSENARRPQGGKSVGGKPEVRIGEPVDAARVLLFTGVRYERYECFDDRMDRKAENHAVHAE